MQSLNKRVQVWWDGNQCYFKGTIIAVSKTCRVKILYDDKQVRWEKLWEEDFSFIDHLAAAPVPSKSILDEAAAAAPVASDEDSDDDEEDMADKHEMKDALNDVDESDDDSESEDEKKRVKKIRR